MDISAANVASAQQRTKRGQSELPITWVEAEMACQPHRVARLVHDGRPVWIKRPSSVRPPGIYRALRLIAWLHGLSVLTPAPRPGGASGLCLEAQRLEALKRLGVWVPEVLLLTEEFLGLSEMPGHDLAYYMQVPGTEPVRPRVWKAGMEAILSVHARGSYISQCFSRNMIVSADLQTVGFIDFEDDPGLVLPTSHAQARDWLLFLLSTAVWVKGIEDRHAILIAVLGREAPVVHDLVWGALRRLAWFRHLPSERRWGKDAWWLQAAAQLGYECKQLINR